MSCHKSQSVPFTLIQQYDELPQEQDKVMEFRLVYSGRILGSSRTNTRPEVKHAIRREFHPQLRRLWQTNGSLQELTKRIGYDHHLTQAEKGKSYDVMRQHNVTSPPPFDDDNGLYREIGADVIPDMWERSGFRFWPLVTKEYCVRCALDFLFLRPEEPGMIIQSGDIDARIKTMFDALRMPVGLTETGGLGPQPDENPFFCLLEDDKLISEIKVTTDNLLLLPKEKEITPNDALLVIHVRLWSVNKEKRWAWAFS